MVELEKKVILYDYEYSFLKKSLKYARTFTYQVNYYYDTNEYELDQKGITCRIRYKDGKYTPTIKEHGNDWNELSVENKYRETDYFDGTPFDGLGLFFQGFLITERTTFYPEKGVEICLDKNKYLGRTDYELEIEYEPEKKKKAEKAVDHIASLLFRRGYIPDKAVLSKRKASSKSARFFERKRYVKSKDNYEKAYE